MISARERRLWRLHRWGDLQDVRENWYEHCIRSYEHLLGQFNESIEVSISREIIANVLDIMTVFQLDSYDAIHAATALATGTRALATMDSDFVRLSSIPDFDVHVIHG